MTDTVQLTMISVLSDLGCSADFHVFWGSFAIPMPLGPSVGAWSYVYYRCIFLLVCCFDCRVWFILSIYASFADEYSLLKLCHCYTVSLF